MNQKLLEQLAMAKEAGSNAHAKEFFKKATVLPSDDGAPSPGGGMDKSVDDMAASKGEGPMAGDGAPEGSPAEEKSEAPEEEMQELLQLLESQRG